MNSTQRRQYEMLLRVREFGNTHRDHLTASTSALEIFAAVNTAIDELTTAAMRKRAASQSAQAAETRAARKALIDLLQNAAHLVKVLRAEGRPIPPFSLPASKSDQALLIAGRQLAVDAATHGADFTGHALSPAYITEITTALETAVNARETNLADHTASQAQLREVISGAVRQVRKLDVIVRTELAHDPAALAVWEQARRTKEPRASQVPARDTPADAEVAAAPTAVIAVGEADAAGADRDPQPGPGDVGRDPQPGPGEEAPKTEAA
jgi:hypothetical protein